MQQRPIDFVIAWVDGGDEAWVREKERYAGENHERFLAKWNDNDVRYRDWGLLPYWFRGVEKFAPWVRTVHFVTCGHLPTWLNVAHPKLHVVRHSDYIPPQYLPTFSSHCIELFMHRIPGLSEQFVYFNDDMFVTAPTSPSDFFINGLPRGTAALAPVQLVQNGIRAEINDLYVINRCFRKRDVMIKNFAKWFSPRYGRLLVKTLLLTPFRLFPGLYISHLPCAYVKKTLEQVWQAAPEELGATCSHRFRTTTDVNQWLFEYWQYATGRFHPRSPRVGRMFEGSAALPQMCESVRRQRYKLICCNDARDIEDFAAARREAQSAFQAILPDACAFERGNSQSVQAYGVQAAHGVSAGA